MRQIAVANRVCWRRPEVRGGTVEEVKEETKRGPIAEAIGEETVEEMRAELLVESAECENVFERFGAEATECESPFEKAGADSFECECPENA